MSRRALYAKEISGGAVTLLATTIAYGSGSALFMYASNLLVMPLQNGTGWSRGDIALGLSMMLIVNAIAMPIVGKLTDRFGPRLIGLSALAGYGICCALLATMPMDLAGYYGLMLAISLFFPGTSAVVFARLVTAKFDHLRGTALAVMYSGTAIILGIIAPTLTGAMGERDFQIGYATLGGIALLLGLPAALLAMRGEGRSNQVSAHARAPEPGMSLGQAVRTLAFWQISIGILASAAALGGMLNQLSPVLADRGLSSSELGMMASLFVGSVLVGRLIVGVLLDTLNPALVSAVLMLLAAFGMLLLLNAPPTLLVCAIVVVLTGSAMGAESDLAAFFSAHFFGRAAYSAILGSVSMFISAGLAASAYLYGSWYDRSGTYDPAIQFSMIAFLLSSVIFASMYARRPFAHVPLATTLEVSAT